MRHHATRVQPPVTPSLWRARDFAPFWLAALLLLAILLFAAGSVTVFVQGDVMPAGPRVVRGPAGR